MKRKEYLKPETQVFQLQSKYQLLAVSPGTMGIYDDEDADVGDII